MTTFTPTTDQIRTEWALSNPGGSPTTIMHAEGTGQHTNHEIGRHDERA